MPNNLYYLHVQKQLCISLHTRRYFKYTENNFSKPNAVPYDVSNNINKNTHFYGAMKCLEMV